MQKEPFNLEFALWDLYKLLEWAGYTGASPQNVEPSELERFEEEHYLPALPNTIGPVNKATQLVMRFVIEVIRDRLQERAD